MFGKHRAAPTSGHGTAPHVASCQQYWGSAWHEFIRSWANLAVINVIVDQNFVDSDSGWLVLVMAFGLHLDEQLQM